MIKSPRSIGFALALVAAFGFSFKAILVKLAYGVPNPIGLDAVTLLTLRMLYSLPAFAYVAWRETNPDAPLNTQHWVWVFVLGLLGYYGASLFDFIGLRYITAGLERLVLASYPTLTLLLGLLIFRERLTVRKIAACCLCYLGIAAAFFHDLSFTSDTRSVWIGSAFVFTSAVSYALYLVGTGRMVGQIGTMRFTAWALLVSSLVTFTHFAVTQPLSALAQPWQVHGFAALMAIFSTVVPVFALSAAIRRLDASSAALIGSTGPLLTILFGWWLLDEPISAVQIAGMVLVVSGVSFLGKR